VPKGASRRRRFREAPRSGAGCPRAERSEGRPAGLAPGQRAVDGGAACKGRDAARGCMHGACRAAVRGCASRPGMTTRAAAPAAAARTLPLPTRRLPRHDARTLALPAARNAV